VKKGSMDIQAKHTRRYDRPHATRLHKQQTHGKNNKQACELELTGEIYTFRIIYKKLCFLAMVN